MQTSLFDNTSVRNKHSQIFNREYERLNSEQKAAVDHIEGPVMVIAGPGTGKTQILTTRIGRILMETDTQAHNILCLTYTEAASIAMLGRLVKIIGPDAHKVHIHTFHSFCNQVIQEHPDLFGNYRQLEPISDLERIDLYKELFHHLPDTHILKVLKGDPKFQMRRLNNLFSLMKRENYSWEFIGAAIDEHYDFLKSDPEMFYKRSGKGYKKGTFKQKAFDLIHRKMEELREASKLFSEFQNLMMRANRYDFDDMILWVLQKFQTDHELLLSYQERYHYFLVDEFQDTNGSQVELLYCLLSYWEDRPNIFAVGDDDQSIYKFQGANMGNIKEFISKYDPFQIVLLKNYRSYQEVLDVAMELIDYNEERIVKEPKFGLNKVLESTRSNDRKLESVIINSYQNITQEQADISGFILNKWQENKDLSDTAIIYRNHRQVEKIVEVLEKKGVPLNVKRKVDILKLPLVKNIINILSYIDRQYTGKGGADRMLFEILHYNFFEIDTHDISKMLWSVKRENVNGFANENDRSLGQLIANREILEPLQLKSLQSICRLSDRLAKWGADINDVTLQVLFQIIINEGHILSYILQHPDRSWLLQVLGTLFDLIKEESSKNADLSLRDFLELIEKMRSNDIELQVNKVVSSEDGVHFLTAHSSKGLEFKYVYIIGVTKNIWDSARKSNRSFTYPPKVKGNMDTNIEDERRLMYVAMTRAMEQLTISYGLQSENGRDLGASRFIDEIIHVSNLPIQKRIVSEDQVVDFQYHLLLNKNSKIEFIDHSLVDRILEGFRLSVTALNKYLKCPVTFYYESILRVPMARTKYMGFGRAVHYALEAYYRQLNLNIKTPKLDFLASFDDGMMSHRSHFTNDEFKDIAAYGHQVLSKYYDEYLGPTDENTGNFAVEVRMEKSEYEGIPVKGVLDSVQIFGNEVVITDYKTGNPASARNKLKLYMPSDKHPLGGDYWRQIVFYKILVESDRMYNWSMKKGVVDFVEPDRKTGEFSKQSYIVSNEQIAFVGDQIRDTWEKIHLHKFEVGCGEEDCFWCDFVKNDYVVDMELMHSLTDDDF